MPRIVYTQEMKSFILDNAYHRNNKELAQLLNDKFNLNLSESSISSYRYKIGALSHIDPSIKLKESGKPFRYKKGHVPLNKGTKGLTGANVTSFKKGNIPWNAKPVGTIVLKADGYLYKKIADVKPSRKGWKQLHHIVWEAEHGKVPDGYHLIFLDQDRTNIDINNLRLVSIANMATLNKKKLLSNDPELNNVMVSITAIDSIIKSSGTEA